MHALEKNIFYLFSFIPASPGAVLPWLITICISTLCWAFTRRLNDDGGSFAQATLEFIYESLHDFMRMIVGDQHLEQLMPLMSTIFIYIFTSNVLGLVPGLKSPTGLFSNCLGMSLIVFCYTMYYGFSTHGFGYIKHFTGTIWWMVPLMLPIHIIGEISRPISLTFRLFGNIMGEDAVILVLSVAIFPLLVPLPMYFMAVFTSLVQAAVFTILTGVYLSGALSEGH
ncbi:MAG TPA: F0F1 ATP synthase subunit A [Candidatus Rifleibacterium sp.]|nr:F0F1 ATP synthase subunit A [Candidatus Rifleibacterium sp.]HPT45995.1 F0F1 ATP synthase subunit A [Candidatus Rifleibacterium sp.]